MAMIKTRKSEKTGKLSYLVAIRIKGHVPVYKTFAKKEIAKRWARETEDLILQGKYVDYSKANDYLLSDAFDRYRDSILPSRSANTIRTTTPKLNKLGRDFENITMSKLKPADLILYVEKLKKQKLKDGTITQYLDTINIVYKAANDVWEISCDSPVPSAKSNCRLHRLLQVDPPRDRRPTADEYFAIINYKKFYPLGLLCEFAAHTAMRREEICNIERKYINCEARTLFIPFTKTRVPRTIPLTTRAVEILKILSDKPTRIDGKLLGIRPDTLTDQFRKMRRELKIKNMVFHDLRHEACSRFFEMDTLNTMEVAAISGHKTLNMLKRYTHLKAENLVSKLP